jgi:transcriptional regulator with XRE-family HTH domain
MPKGGAALNDVAMPAEQIDSLIAANVRAIRARRQERQEDLAADLGWSRPVVGDLENGRRRVTMADVIALCRALEVDLNELLRGVSEDDLRVLGLDRRRG